MNLSKQTLALIVSGSLVISTARSGWADEHQQPMAPPAPATAVPATATLDQLVAPIALYPDNLVAQILAASTWPAQVVEADRWMQQNSGLTGLELAQGVDRQSWDPSVKGLTQFPLVLASMDRNLAWSSALGNAYANQPQMVLDAIQVMRWRARQAGHLNGNANEIVTIEGSTISIYPPAMQTVYLPEYDPWLVYGSPVATWPDWDATPGLYIDDPGVWFGPAVWLGTFAGFGWGWHHWGTDWHRHGTVFNQDPYRSRVEGARGERVGGLPGVNVPHPTFAPNGAAAGGPGRGAFGNRGFNGFNHGGIARPLASPGALAFGGGFHGGGFHGGGHR
jgi:hypothetical protein